MNYKTYEDKYCPHKLLTLFFIIGEMMNSNKRHLTFYNLNDLIMVITKLSKGSFGLMAVSAAGCCCNCNTCTCCCWGWDAK
jgi:hypothetical protein